MRRLKSLRGFTLMELVIVMAVVSIMSVMVVSFTVLCNGWSQWGIGRYRVTDSERAADGMLREFVAAYDNQDYYFGTADEGAVLVATAVADPTERHTMYLNDNGALAFALPTNGDGLLPLDHITSVHFDVTDGEGKQLIRMRMAYNITNTVIKRSSTVGSYTVLVCARATGEAV